MVLFLYAPLANQAFESNYSKSTKVLASFMLGGLTTGWQVDLFKRATIHAILIVR